jgi:hypothetical protein
MITPDSFRKTCSEILGKDCEFVEYQSDYPIKTKDAYPGDYYVRCDINGKKVAILHISRNLKSTATIFYGKDKYEFVNYMFTLRHYLNKYKKYVVSTRQKMFNVYRKITDDVGTTQNDITQMISYLTNVEFIKSNQLTKMLQLVFYNWSTNYPKEYPQAAIEMFEYFTKQVEIKNVKKVD